MQTTTATKIATINHVPLLSANEVLSDEQIRQRAYAELLRQAAITNRLLPSDDASPMDGAMSERASDAIETLLEQVLQIPAPGDEACHRHYVAHLSRYRTGERVHARHILFSVVQGADVVALRNRAETALLDVRCRDDREPSDKFGIAAGKFSNCPSGAKGGDLGWLTIDDCAPEFARELFGHTEVGVLPRLVHSRFGLHVVEVLARESGLTQPFEDVRGAVEVALCKTSYVTALRQYLQVLAGEAKIEGLTLETADNPLVQ